MEEKTRAVVTAGLEAWRIGLAHERRTTPGAGNRRVTSPQKIQISGRWMGIERGPRAAEVWRQKSTRTRRLAAPSAVVRLAAERRAGWVSGGSIAWLEACLFHGQVARATSRSVPGLVVFARAAEIRIDAEG